MENAQLRVNLWGHLSGGFGLGEGARATARALRAAGVLVQACDLPLSTHPNDQALPPSSATRLPAPVQAATALEVPGAAEHIFWFDVAEGPASLRLGLPARLQSPL